jgi:mono/diheme cytochrome c family protein
LIVKQADDGRWLDDNNKDWTEFISGEQAASSGRVPGWELLDHDISVIETSTHEVTYVSGLMNIGMAIGFNQATNSVTLVGTDATNEIRFEPVIKGTFLRVMMGVVSNQGAASPLVMDLNPHLDYLSATAPQSVRDQSIGDPRGVVWNQSGDLGYVSGMGSDNVIVINQSGERQAMINVGEGATGLALDDDNQRLYVWNHFAASLSVVDLVSQAEISQTAVFNPLPEAIKQGRQFLYNTHETSGLGQASCASCHVDGRMDRLAWDLGDPAGETKDFNQNCQTTSSFISSDSCSDFHPMKGPMVTQTFQDIIGHEPFHWRGDRDGLEEFNGAFEGLNGDDEVLSPAQMQQFKAMLATITFPPNPFRNIDNSLPDSVDLSNHYTSGRFQPAGISLGSGDPIKGLNLYNTRVLDTVFQCASCHTLPTGMAVNGPLKPALVDFPVGGQIMPPGPMGENHLGVVSVDGSTQKAFKTPQLRNMYEKVGFETSRSQSLAGFGFLHDGAIDSIARFLSTGAFSVNSDQEVADLVALMMAFSGSELSAGAVPLGNTPPESQDTHAGVGQQHTLTAATQIDAEIDELLAVADTDKVDLIVESGSQGSYLYDANSQQFQAANNQTISTLGLMSLAASDNPLTFSLVPEGLGVRLAFDRDGDGIKDSQEIKLGSDPADANSTTVKPKAGMWFNPDRSGHGMDLQHAGDRMFIIWYTYNDDGSPTWYIAADEYSPNWQASLLRVTWDANSRSSTSEVVGVVQMDFSDAKHAEFSWQLNGRASAEPFQYFDFAGGDTINQQTGSYYDANDSGWGVSVITQGAVAVSVMFFYDDNGEPIWALGTAENKLNSNIEMFTNNGFCPDCEFQPTTDRVLVGALNLAYSNSRLIDFDVNLVDPLNSINWQLNDVVLSPLSSELFDPALQ